MRNVKDYGAVGDGVCLDTAAIQRAIDDGGMVYIPDGDYRIGTIYLKSNGGLHLASGARLTASHERADYNADDFCPQNRVFTSEFVTGAHLIVAVEQENIVIEGHGTIDGQGDFWMNESKTNVGWPNPEERDYAPNAERPGQMIFLCECKNIHITDVNIQNGPYWHLFLHGCDTAFIRGLSIRGARPRWTNDGIDIDCCSRVTVSDCIVDVGDDALTLRGYDAPLLHNNGACENIAVSNCVLRSARDFGIRIGVGDGVIRNACFSNLDIEAPNLCGIGIMGRWNEEATTVSSAENIVFSNCNIRSIKAVDIFSAESKSLSEKDFYIRNITFSNMRMTASEPCRIAGTNFRKIENIRFSDILISFLNSGCEEKVAFKLNNAKAIDFNNVNICAAEEGMYKIAATDKCEKIRF